MARSRSSLGRAFPLVALVACGSPPPPPAELANHAGPSTPRDAATSLIARWSRDAPLSDHAVTVVLHCIDGEPDRPQVLPPDEVNSLIVQTFGPVTHCDARCCDVVPDPKRPDVVVRKLCFDPRYELDRLVADVQCHGD